MPYWIRVLIQRHTTNHSVHNSMIVTETTADYPTLSFWWIDWYLNGEICGEFTNLWLRETEEIRLGMLWPEGRLVSNQRQTTHCVLAMDRPLPTSFVEFIIWTRTHTWRPWLWTSLTSSSLPLFMALLWTHLQTTTQYRYIYPDVWFTLYTTQSKITLYPFWFGYVTRSQTFDFSQQMRIIIIISTNDTLWLFQSSWDDFTSSFIGSLLLFL